MQDSIFVSIASYRDPELVPTIQDCLAKASRPDRVRFGICWQHGDDDVLPSWLSGGAQFAIWDVHWRESRGACWARAGLMDLWAGEDWYLQLDSHHRFVKGWDTLLLAEAARSHSPRPVLSTYAPAYSPTDAACPDSALEIPTTIEFDDFQPDGIPVFRPRKIPGGQRGAAPRRARFVSAHFLFAPGEFVRDVPYDPQLYFLGEEIALAVRAFTSGYDLFEPSQPILWHQYTREGRRKHWEDHTGDSGPPWYELDRRSRSAIGLLLHEQYPGRYGLGHLRSLRDYESFAGISFDHTVVQDYTRYNQEPPNPPAAPDWMEHIRIRDIPICIDRAWISTEVTDHTAPWCIAVYDSDGMELNRQAITCEELSKTDGPYVMTTMQLASQARPAAWAVLPCSASRDRVQPTHAHRIQGLGEG